MKVFISSVTYQLKEERAALVPFLRLFDHEPLRFEDFSAQDRSSREACLAGVEAADATTARYSAMPIAVVKFRMN